MNGAIEQSQGKSSDLIHVRAAEILGSDLKPNRDFLDLGCGAGAFARRIRAAGLQSIHCCDGGVFGDLVDFSFRQLNLNQPLPYERAAFDIVASLEVIEHVENPRAFVREIHRILKPGGIALVSTPNNESFTSLLSLFLRGYFSQFSDRDYPAHISPILEIDARRMFQEAKFSRVEVFWSGGGRIPGSSVAWQSILGGAAKGKRFSDNFFLRAVK